MRMGRKNKAATMAVKAARAALWAGRKRFIGFFIATGKEI